jgi:hypothetical protein
MVGHAYIKARARLEKYAINVYYDFYDMNDNNEVSYATVPRWTYKFKNTHESKMPISLEEDVS